MNYFFDYKVDSPRQVANAANVALSCGAHVEHVVKDEGRLWVIIRVSDPCKEAPLRETLEQVLGGSHRCKGESIHGTNL